MAKQLHTRWDGIVGWDGVINRRLCQCGDIQLRKALFHCLSFDCNRESNSNNFMEANQYPPCPASTTKHEKGTALSIHLQFNTSGSEATSLFDIGRSMLNVHFYITFFFYQVMANDGTGDTYEASTFVLVTSLYSSSSTRISLKRLPFSNRNNISLARISPESSATENSRKPCAIST